MISQAEWRLMINPDRVRARVGAVSASLQGEANGGHEAGTEEQDGGSSGGRAAPNRRAFGRLGGERCRELGEAMPHHLHIRWQIPGRSEHRREAVHLQPPQQQVGVGDGERSAGAITGRARLCSG